MPMRPTSTYALILTLSLALITSACSSSKKTPDIKQNPNPKQRFDITMQLDNAPGPFDSVTGFAQFDIKNSNCVPTDSFSGAKHTPTKNIEVDFKLVADDIYRATVYADSLEDEDYFNLGVCHWSLTAVAANLKIHKVTLSPNIDAAHIFSGSHSETEIYFANKTYFDTVSDGRNDFGTTNREVASQNPKEFFSVLLIARESPQ